MPSLAIVGAGLAGLAAAHALRDAGLTIRLFEKSRGVSGRAATRSRDGVRYDHGANYARLGDDPRVRTLVLDLLPRDGLATIDAPVWTFDGDGRVAPGDADRDADAKWTYRDGISGLGKRLHAAAGAPLATETRIERLHAAGGAWRLVDAAGVYHGPFDAVLLTPPAPQAAELLAASELGAAPAERLRAGLRAARYRMQVTSVLAFDAPVDRPGGAYALVNTDGAHPVAWLGFEEAKPGHVPEGRSVLVAQMAPAWSFDHYGLDADALADAVRPLVSTLLGHDLPAPAWVDRQGWRYALPDDPADAEALAAGAPHGLFFAGDGVAGRGRIAAALASGLDAAPRIAAYFTPPGR